MTRLRAVQLVRGYRLLYWRVAVVVDDGWRPWAGGVLVVVVNPRHHAGNAYSCGRVCLTCDQRNGQAAPDGVQVALMAEGRGRKDILSICLKMTKSELL